MNLPPTPAKIQGLLSRAAELGMVVEFRPDERPNAYSTVHVWIISSGKRHDHDAVWIYWTPGANGGRVRLVRYQPYAKHPLSRTAKLTYAACRTWMWVLSK